MSMQRLLFSEDDLSDADIIRILNEETTFGGNNNEPFANTHTMQSLNTDSNAITWQNHQKPILGQNGLSHVVTTYQTTQGSSNANGRVTQPMNSHGVQVTEIVRDHVITISTRQRISISNQCAVFPNQLISENTVEHGVMNQTPTEGLRNSSSHITGFQSKHNFGGVGVSSKFHMHSDETSNREIHPNFQLNCNSRGPEFPIADNHPKVDGYREQNNHAPFKCSKCGERFTETQCYADHVVAHYQSEKIAERLRRRESRHGEKLLLGQINNEVQSEGHRSKKPKKTTKNEYVVKKE